MPKNTVFTFSLLLAILLVASSALLGQNQANVWYFGANAGLNFNTGTPPTPLLNGQLATLEGCSSIADDNGNLLFYTDGVGVWDRNHNVMPSGTGLLGDASSTQSSLVVPYVGDKDKYYIFTTDGITCSATGPKGKWDGLHYSVIDMALNGGNGDVVPGFKNRPLVDTTREQITAARHANGIDFWVITRKHYTNKYYTYLVTCNGVDTANPVISVVGATFNRNMIATSTGALKASPNSDAILSAFQYGYNEVYDFDNSSGVLSNARTLSTNLDSHYGASFSPDGQVLYIAGGMLQGGSQQIGQIFRYELNAPSLPASEVIANFPGSYIQGMQLGPDGKIYFAHSYNGHNDSLGVIDNPNNYANPNIIYNYAFLGGRTSQLGLPNYFDAGFYVFPELASNDTSVCENEPVELGKAPVSGLSYFWSPAAGLSNPTSSNPTLTT